MIQVIFTISKMSHQGDVVGCPSIIHPSIHPSIYLSINLISLCIYLSHHKLWKRDTNKPALAVLHQNKSKFIDTNNIPTLEAHRFRHRSHPHEFGRCHDAQFSPSTTATRRVIIIAIIAIIIIIAIIAIFFTTRRTVARTCSSFQSSRSQMAHRVGSRPTTTTCRTPASSTTTTITTRRVVPMAIVVGVVREWIHCTTRTHDHGAVGLP